MLLLLNGIFITMSAANYYVYIYIYMYIPMRYTRRTLSKKTPSIRTNGLVLEGLYLDFGVQRSVKLTNRTNLN